MASASSLSSSPPPQPQPQPQPRAGPLAGSGAEEKTQAFIRDGGHKRLLDELKSRASDKGEAIQRLGKLTRDRRAARKIARNKDTINTLLSSVSKSPRFSKLVEYSLECLKNLAVDEVSVEEMVDEGALQVLVNVTRLNPYNEKIMLAVSNCVKALSLNDYLAKMITDKLGASCAESLIFSLRKHVEPDTVVATCGAIEALMKHAGNVDLLVGAGLLDALAHVLNANADNPNVLAAAAKVASRVADSPKHAEALIKSGVVERLLSAMRNNPSERELNAVGAAMLAKLATAGNEAVVKELQRLGAVDLLVALAEANPLNKELLASAAAALRALTGEADLGSALEIVASGANMHLTAMAMAKIASLCLVEENVALIIKQGGIAKIVAAIQAAAREGAAGNEAALRVVESGMRALMRLGTTEANIYNIMQEGGVKLAVSLLKAYVGDERVASAALGLLARSATRKENTEYLLKCGAAEAAVVALKAHPHSELIVKYGMSLLEGLAVHEGNVERLVAAGAMEAVVGAMHEHLESAEIVAACIRSLGCMALSAENLRAMVKAGGLPLLVEVLKEHCDDPELTKQALLLIESAALLPENLDPLRALGTLEAVLHAMERHPANDEIQAIGARCLGLIAGQQQLVAAVGHVQALLGQLQRAPSSLGVVMQNLGPALRLLASLAMIEDNLGVLQQAGGVQALTQSFILASKQAASAERDAVMAAAVQGLVRLVRSEADALQLVESGALKNMIAHAIRCVDNEALAESVITLCHVLAQSPAVAAILVRDGTLASILELVRAFPLNESVLTAAVQALAALCKTDADCLAVLTKGGAEVLVDAIYANMDQAPQLLATLECLPVFVRNEACASALVEAGALDAILDVLRNHPSNAHLVLACIKALASLLVCPRVGALIGEKGALPLLLRALRDHYSVEDIVESDLVLLDQLSLVRSNAQILVDPELGTLQLVEWAASTFHDNQQVQTAARHIGETLREFMRDASESGAAAGSTGAGRRAGARLDVAEEKKGRVDLQQLSAQDAARLLHILRDEAASAAQLASVLGDIAEMALNPQNAAVLVQQGGLEALAAVMLAHRGNEGLFHAATVAFQNLANSISVSGQLAAVPPALESPAVIEALVEMLQPHPEHVKELTAAELAQALAILTQLAGKDANVARMLEASALQPLLRILSSTKDPELLVAAAKLLAKISQNDQAAALLGKLADLRALIQAIRTHFKNEEFVKFAVYLLGNLAVNDAIKNQVGIEGGVQVVVQVLAAYPQNKGTVENSCYALSNFTYECEVNISLAVACRAIEEALAAVARYPTEGELIQFALALFCNLCYKNDGNKRRIVESGGARAIVQCILDNLNNQELLNPGFRCLGNLAFFAPNVPVIVREGGVQAIVAAMTLHSSSLDIVDMAIRVLSNLAADVDVESMKIMSQEGAVQAVVEVALRHSDNLDLELASIACLCNLAKEHENSRMIVRQNGLEAVEKAMRALSFDLELSEKSVRLAQVLASNPANRDSLLASSIVQVLLDSLTWHKTSGEVASGVFAVVTSLSYSKEAANQLAQGFAIRSVLQSFYDFIRDPNVLIEACHALSALCRSENNAATMSEQAMKALALALQTHVKNEAFCNHALTYLANMCVFPNASVAVLGSPIISAILAVFAQCGGNAEVVLRGLRALENIASSTNAVKDHLKAKGVVSAMQDIASKWAQREDVARSAQRVIDVINSRVPDGSGDSNRPRRMLFRDDNKDEPVLELPDYVRNFLTAGALLSKHSNTAPPRPRYVFVTPDLKYLVWKDPKDRDPEGKEKQRMKVYLIRSVEKGRCTPQLQRKKRFGGYNANEDCAFAVFGRERTVDLEAATEELRDMWVKCIQILIDYVKATRKANQQF
jgi:hypothetical protein